MIDNAVKTNWKRFADQVRGLWSDRSKERAKELSKASGQPATEGGALPQSTTQSPHSDSSRVA
jgi:hypothetical protein